MTARRPPSRRGPPWVALAVLAVLGGCSGPVEAPIAQPAIVPSDGPRPDVVIIVLSGVRKDSRPEDDQSGALIRAFPTPPLAEFTAAYATSASTFTAFASLITGLYPAAIPICRPREGSSTLKGRRVWCTELPSARPSLPDIMAAYGYDTVFLSTGGVGFDTFAERFEDNIHIEMGSADQPRDASLAQAAGTWWTAHQDQPRFLLAHLGVIEEAMTLDQNSAKFKPLPPEAQPTMTSRGPVMNETQQAAMRTELKKRYTAEIAALAPALTAFDAALIPAGLSPTGRDRYTTLLSVSSVNLGETTGFGQEHSRFDAYQLLLERSLHVPVAIWGPALPASGPPPSADAQNEIAELTDILPTLLARVTAVLPAGAVGRDLLGGAPDTTPWAYADFGDMLSVRQGPYRLTLRTYQHDGSSLDPALTPRARVMNNTDWTFHHVVDDPLEVSDLYGSAEPEPAEAIQRLHRTLMSVRSGDGAPPPDAITPEKLWQLRMSAGRGYW